MSLLLSPRCIVVTIIQCTHAGDDDVSSLFTVLYCSPCHQMTYWNGHTVHHAEFPLLCHFLFSPEWCPWERREQFQNSLFSPFLNPPLSPLSIIPPLLRCPCECPRCNGCFTATDSNAVPLPGLTKLLSEGGRKAFPAPCLPSLHGNVGAESGSSLVEGWERGGFV